MLSEPCRQRRRGATTRDQHVEPSAVGQSSHPDRVLDRGALPVSEPAARSPDRDDSEIDARGEATVQPYFRQTVASSACEQGGEDGEVEDVGGVVVLEDRKAQLAAPAIARTRSGGR